MPTLLANKYKINSVLTKENIKREAYFEKKFNGVNIRKLMDRSDTIKANIKPILKADNKGNLSEADIDATCAKYQALLDKADAALKGLATPFPSPDQMENTKKDIKQSVELAKEMGLSTTPKWHVVAVHCFPQHERLVKEGWGFILDESFIDREVSSGRGSACTSIARTTDVPVETGRRWRIGAPGR
mmetsp:Transcript_23853/g.51645  ORF Transcript_23853/g.51645 Transcript_23853/m.51645 type:complete len:187 (+) Transcript_23853:178-738(+)